MHKPEHVYQLLQQKGINFFAGVPDSLLKDFCAYVTDNAKSEQHVITANEGNAIALAAGHYLGSGSAPLVYMQNSGIGNAVNPLTSLTDPEVYSIPMLLMIGWRGEPGVKDEPQHVKQGRIMIELLDALEIPWFKISKETTNIEDVINQATTKMQVLKSPVALLISKGTFEKYQLQNDTTTAFPMKREQAVEEIVKLLGQDDLVVSTTGMTSRELFEIRENRGESHSNDFLTVGAMGHTSSIALGLAKASKDRRVVCLDGDGSVLMHMGAMAINGNSKIANLTHVVINNGAHDSVGGQPTLGFAVDLPSIAKHCGYEHISSVDNKDDLKKAITEATESTALHFVEVKVEKGARDDLGRPTTTPIENKHALMSLLNINE